MGSICRVHRIEQWNILEKGNLKSNNKPAYLVGFGEWDDYGGGGYISEVMLPTVYEKIMNREYSVTSQAYSTPPIIVKNHNGEVIDLLTGGIAASE